jgi:putative SbcD/Mre11-related phosphoesterase
MKIYDGIEVKGPALHFTTEDVLVITDLQIGYEEVLLRRGVLFPKTHLKDILKVLKKILFNKKFSKIIINGDFKHDFGRVSEQEWRESLRVIDILNKHCDELIFVMGNHDTMIGPIAKKRNVLVVEKYRVGDAILFHGDKKMDIPKDVKLIVIGHCHAAIGLKRDIRVENYKCFLKGSYVSKDGRKDLIIMPSFNPLMPGTDVLKERFKSPYVPKDISSLKKFEVFVVEDKEYYFGKIGDLIDM